MKVAVVGGGIVGLFTAYYLEREGAEVTLFEEGDLGAGSVHAAGIIEPTTAYRTNTISFLKRVWRLWKNDTCVFRRVDPAWLVESARQLERAPLAGSDEIMRSISKASVAQYKAMAEEKNDFSYTELGLLERFDDPDHFAEERDLALSQRSVAPVDVRPEVGPAGGLFFPEVSWLHTERFVDRMRTELRKTQVVRQRVRRIELSGSVATDKTTSQFDAVAVCAGVACRRVGVPLTGVRGYGWHTRAKGTLDVTTIFVDRGIALVPFADEVKATGGWDFDLSAKPFHSQEVLDAVRKVIDVESILDYKEGSRPCTPDGLPTIGQKDRVVVATGGFRLGWSFGPGMGQAAALLCLGRTRNDPFLARFCTSLRSGSL